MITREQLTAELQQIREQEEAARRQLLALSGARQMLERLLSSCAAVPEDNHADRSD